MAEIPLYPGNSHKDREEEKKLEIEKTDSSEKKKITKVVKGTVSKKKKSVSDSFASVFFGEQARAVGNYILWDVLIPAAKDTLNAMVRNGMEMMLYGKANRDGNLRRDKDRTYISYNSMYDRDRGSRRDRDDHYERPRTSSRFDFSDIVFDRRSDAEDVLAVLDDAIDTYDVVTVAEFYDACDLESNSADRKYGWDRLTGAEVRRVRDGYILNMPRPIVLE